MKLVLDLKDVEDILLATANTRFPDMRFNKIEIEGYGTLRSVEISYEKTETETAPEGDGDVS